MDWNYSKKSLIRKIVKKIIDMAIDAVVKIVKKKIRRKKIEKEMCKMLCCVYWRRKWEIKKMYGTSRSINRHEIEMYWLNNYLKS